MIKIFKIQPWQKTFINGPLSGTSVKNPMVIGKLIKKAKRPLLVVGGYEYNNEIGNGKKYIDLLIKIAKSGIPVVTTTEITKNFIKNGVKPVAIMSVANVIQRICDEKWKGYDGKGPYDLIILGAMIYYLQAQCFSGLKHFAYKWSKFVSLDRYYQPGASFSLANLKVNDWNTAINEIVKIILE